MIKILLVDDSDSQRAILKHILKKNGYEYITEASDGQIALQKATQEFFDLIITDINMSNLNGIDLIKKLRTLDSYKKQPIIIITAEQALEAKEKSKNCGASGYITKPYSKEQLLYILEKILENHQIIN